MRVGVGPAYYEIARTMDSGPAIKLGPGFTSGKETPEHIVCKKLYNKWSKIDNQLSKEQQIVEKEKQERDDGGEENDEHTGSKYAFSENKKD
jgi:hypothetical protein